jgi:hypothetical protein
MRYFKGSSNKTIDAEKVAGEMLNICLGTTYFEDGKLVDSPKIGHNTYNIDSVEYEIHPNYGVLMLAITDVSFKALLEAKYRELYNALIAKFGPKSVCTGMHGSTQYLLLENKTYTLAISDATFVHNMSFRRNALPTGAKFVWNIVDKGNISYVLPIPGYSALQYDTYERMSSLSAIIYDDINLLTLIDGFRSANYPHITKYSLHKSGLILEKPVSYSFVSGLTLEIAKLEMEKLETTKLNGFSIGGTKSTKAFAFIDLKRSLSFAKWEELKPFIYSQVESVLDWSEQINKGLLDEEKTTDESDEIEIKKNKNEQYSCFVTNLPLYEDCYVFDIYSRIVEEYINRNDLDKYTGAQIIAEDVKVENNKSTKKNNKKTLVKEDSENDGSDEDTKVSLKARTKSNTKRTAKKSVVLEKKTSTKKTSTKKTSTKKTTTKKTTTKNTHAKKKQVDKDEQLQDDDELQEDIKPDVIKIRREIKFDKPRCVLLSALYVHFMDSSLDQFEKKTNTKGVLYRTFCPNLFKDVVDNLNVTNTHKKVLKSMYVNFKVNFSTDYRSQNVMLSSNYTKTSTITDVENPDTTVIKATLLNYYC